MEQLLNEPSGQEMIGGFPADFPFAAKLVEAGILDAAGATLALDEELLDIPGIGPASVTKIREAADAFLIELAQGGASPSDIHEASARETEPDATAAATGAANDDAGDGDTPGAGEPAPAPVKSLVEEAYDLFRAGREEDFPLTWSELSDLERKGFQDAAERIVVPNGEKPVSNFDRAVYAVLNPIV